MQKAWDRKKKRIARTKLHNKKKSSRHVIQALVSGDDNSDDDDLSSSDHENNDETAQKKKMITTFTRFNQSPRSSLSPRSIDPKKLDEWAHMD